MTRKGDRKASTEGLSKEEIAAMKDRLKELNSGKNEGEGAVLSRIESMGEKDRTLAKRIHTIVKENAPDLTPRLWYGMPAFSKDGKVVLFFQDANKFKSRYATLGFSDKANLDDDNVWPVVYALSKLTKEDEDRIRTLVRKAVS